MSKSMDLIVHSIFLFTIGFIIMVQLPNNSELIVYGAAIISIFYIIFYFMSLSQNKSIMVKNDNIKRSKNMRSITTIAIIYFLYVIISMLVIDKSKWIYTVLRMVALMTFIVLINHFDRIEYDLSKLKDFCCKIFIISGSLALIMYICGYSSVAISLKNILNFVPKQYYITVFGEPRLTWMNTHKARFALYCIIGIGFILSNKRISQIKKTIFTSILVLDIYLSNTYTALAIVIIIIFYFFITTIKNLNSYLKVVISVILTLAFSLTLIVFNSKLTNNRDVSSFGARKYIWQAGIERVLDKPSGIVQITESDWFQSDYIEDFTLTNAHNIFINEMMERGIVGGILYILLFCLICKQFLKDNKKFYFVLLMGIIFGGMFDYTISSEMLYVFWYTIALLYSE